MTLNRMGNTQRTGKHGFGGRRAWITGAVAVGVVATSGAVASATINSSEDTGTPSDECLTLDAQSMQAIFQAWMQKGGSFQPGNPDASMPPPVTSDPPSSPNPTSTAPPPTSMHYRASDNSKLGAAGSHHGRLMQPSGPPTGLTPAQVPMSELTVGTCDGDTAPGTDPTDPPPVPTTTAPGGSDPVDPVDPPTSTPPAPTVTSTAS